MSNQNPIQLALPKGRMLDGVLRLLEDAGCPATISERNYRVQMPLDGVSTKLLKPQGIVEMLAAGRRDLGFAGADWVEELGAELVPLLDTGLNPVQVVAAAPEKLLMGGKLPDRKLVVASEYARITQNWMEETGMKGTFVRSWGATEVLPPEDADVIVDNTATGSTLRANRLQIVETLMTSSTRLYANPRSLERPEVRERAETLVLVLESVLNARKRSMVELNAGNDVLDAVLALLPCMREPTLASLRGGEATSVKAAVPKKDVARLIPELKAAGASDIVVMPIGQIVA